MIDPRGMCHDTDIGVGKQRWSPINQQCSCTFSLAGPFDMVFIRHGDEVAYVP